MQVSEPKQQFISAWGTMASNWGISRSTAQVHAILLSSSEPINGNV